MALLLLCYETILMELGIDQRNIIDIFRNTHFHNGVINEIQAMYAIKA
ncbi:hypothetical protein HMPREF3214_01366 [Alloscardovia omnicolens]|nr:hypothetical protein HMPREF3214_01366 [Alloscardovia omnicolens]